MATYLHNKKSAGETIRSADWNALGDKLQSISAKLDEENNIYQGELKVSGDLTVGTNPIKFSSQWSNSADKIHAEISNDTKEYKTLMLVGNRSNDDKTRRVSVWDRLEVNGDSKVTGATTLTGAATLKSTLKVDGTTTLARLTISEATGTTRGANTGTLILDHENSGGASSIVFRSKINRGSDYGYIQYQDAARVGGSGESARLIIGTSNDTDDHLILSPTGNVGIGTTTPGAKLEVNGDSKITGSLEVLGSITGNGTVVRGIIVMWSGTAIPPKWALCDGQDGRPDLRGRFVLGLGNGSNLTPRTGAQTGGVESVSITVAQMPSHVHGVSDPSHSHNWTASRQQAGTDDNNNDQELSKGDAGAADLMSKNTDKVPTGISIDASGGGNAHENMPPFYVLAFIMKL